MDHDIKIENDNNSTETTAVVDYVCNLDIDDQLFLENIDNRHVYINDIIDQEIAEQVVYHIARYNIQDKNISLKKRKPIKLFICSPGGSVDDGFRIISAIESSRTPIHTINTGYCYSMAFLLLISGDVRYGMQYSTYLLHEGEFGSYNSDSKATDEFEFNLLRNAMIKEYVLSRTQISSQEYEQNRRKEWYMFSDTAKEKSVIDFIIGNDIMFDDVL